MFTGGNIQLDKLRDFKSFDIASDLGFTSIRPLGGKSGNVWNIHMVDDVDWAANLKKLADEFRSRNMKLALHELGDPWRTLLGILAPYYNYQPVSAYGATYTPTSQALNMVDQLAGDNNINYNFIADPVFPYWQVINEAPTSNQTVIEWTTAVADRIRSHGGKTTGALCDWPTPYADFRPVMSLAADHFDFLQAHEYAYTSALSLIGSQGSNADIYQAVYDKADDRFGLMVSTCGDFGESKVILGEWGMMHGAFKPPGMSTTYQVSLQQHADYVRAVFDALKDNGLSNQYYHLIYDDSGESWGVVSSSGAPVSLVYDSFRNGMSLLNGEEVENLSFVNETSNPVKVYKRPIVVDEFIGTVDAGDSIDVVIDETKERLVIKDV